MVEATYGDDPESLNLARYIGQVQPENTNMISTNKQIVQSLSWPIAQFTAQHYANQLEENLEEREKELVQQVQGAGIQYISDAYGRITYFYVQLGDKRLPVYQPTTIEFMSGVSPDGDLAIEADGV